MSPTQALEASASQTYILMSPRKLRRVVNEIRGKRAGQAHQILQLMPYTAARVVLKKLREAMFNAQVKYDVQDANQLVVSEVFVDEGPAYKRFKPRAQGRIYRRERPTSHITLRVKVVK